LNYFLPLRGRFGHVFQVKMKESKALYAMKVLFKKELVDQGEVVVSQVAKEIEIQHKLRHKYVARLYWATQDSKRVYIFTELAIHGNLYKHLKKVGKLPEPITGKYIRQLLNALTYLHHHGIVHRDIKPENLLLGIHGNLLLTDFGCSTEMTSRGRSTVCGTPEYLPPEMISHQQYSNSVDSWTCGVLCYEFLTGKVPFVGQVNPSLFFAPSIIYFSSVHTPES
jgi:aurora kinase, other